jgi:hypothetical protein
MVAPVPGPVVLFGSGETSASGRRIFDWLFHRLEQPLRVSILETPAGFELNSARVAGRVADFLVERLQNYQPQVTVVPARKRGTPMSPDNPDVLDPLLRSNAIFLGPGSPTYAVRQLEDSLAWHMVTACHRQGAALILASAATIAASHLALPVYEIYKVGEDPFWHRGLDLFAPFGLSLVFMPHWNNNDGGAELDTSRCYMGLERFEPLRLGLPPEVTIVGIDEHTGLAVDFARQACRVVGRGSVTIQRGEDSRSIAHGHGFRLAELGPYRPPEPQAGIPASVWEQVAAAYAVRHAPATPEPPEAVLQRLQRREAARAERDWSRADSLRQEIEALGWEIRDTPEGPQAVPRP